MGKVVLRISPLLSYELGRGVHLRPERLAQIQAETLRLVSDGFSQREIAAAMGATTSRLSRWCRHAVMTTNAPLRLLNFTDRTLVQTMWDRIELAGPNECWNWVGSVKDNGYGALNFKGQGYQAHRLVYETLIGAIPDGKVIDHICSNPKCVNPKHLQAVTQTENIMLGARRARNA